MPELLRKLKLTDSFILGAVQGVAEWLPISSSGHLVVFRDAFNLEGTVSFDIFLHLSALFVIFAFFRHDISRVAKALFSLDRTTGEFQTGLYIIYASLITAVTGILLKQHVESLATVTTVRWTFLATSILLFCSARKGTDKIGFRQALLMGLMQGLALLPGISRSGATISAAKAVGVKGEEAFRFSFLMAIPAITGAVAYECRAFGNMPLPILMTGFTTSLLLGFISLYFLRKVIKKGQFHLFGFYTLLLSLLLFCTL